MSKENNWEIILSASFRLFFKDQEIYDRLEDLIRSLLTKAIQEERQRILQKVNRMNWFEYPDDCLKELKQYLSKINKE